MVAIKPTRASSPTTAITANIFHEFITVSPFWASIQNGSGKSHLRIAITNQNRVMFALGHVKIV
jgi:hypothetical protein